MFAANWIPIIGIMSLAFGVLGTTVSADELGDSLPLEAPPTMRSPADTTSEQETHIDTSPLPDVAETVECPPGQFPSTFSDVYPSHWAYAAVHSLTSEAIQCFDWPEASL